MEERGYAIQWRWERELMEGARNLRARDQESSGHGIGRVQLYSQFFPRLQLAVPRKPAICSCPMASRRPTTRIKPSTLPPAQSQHRIRPAAKELHTQNAPNSTAPGFAKTSESAGSNIQVIIRCRNRSDREVHENTPIIVTSNGAKSKEISIETGTPQSSLGVVTLPPLRTYPFDLVFGPEADQAMIYHDVVSPMLEEVVAGYNCTLFAYGQTGTGKTYAPPLTIMIYKLTCTKLYHEWRP